MPGDHPERLGADGMKHERKAEIQSATVVIIGGGPHALAVLSALHESSRAFTQFPNDEMYEFRVGFSSFTKTGTVAIIDPAEKFMDAWNTRFEVLGIKQLRSPAFAHPMAFEAQALVHYAVLTGRTKELACVPEFTRRAASEDVSSQEPLMQGFPSTALFRDFCKSLESKLAHTWLRGTCSDVQKQSDTSTFLVRYKDSVDEQSRTIQANAVVLATGHCGAPRIPPPFHDLMSTPLITHASELLVSTRRFDDLKSPLRAGARILVIGGGITAAHTALAAFSAGYHVVLRSRRPLMTRQHDLPAQWLDLRHSSRLRNQFFRLPIEERHQHCILIKGGGSVPREYMDQLQRAASKFEAFQVQVDEQIDDSIIKVNRSTVVVNGEEFDHVILATGEITSISHAPLYASIERDLNAPSESGLPRLDDSLRWITGEDLFVVGANAELVLGPDARNLMGAMRGARLVAQELHHLMWSDQCKRASRPGVLANPFSLLAEDDADCKQELETSETCTQTPTLTAPTVLPEAMLRAARRGEMKKVLKWLRVNSINAQEAHQGNTLLHCAVINKQLDLVRALVERGADVNLANDDGSTALMAAAESGCHTVTQILLESLADTGMKTHLGITALMTASQHRHYEVLQLLIRHGSPVDARTTYGMTALMQAARNGADKCVQTLLGASACTVKQCKSGKNALAYAREQGHASTQIILLQNGPSCSLSPKLGPHEALIDVGNGKLVQVSESNLRISGRHRASRLRKALLSQEITTK